MDREATARRNGLKSLLPCPGCTLRHDSCELTRAGAPRCRACRRDSPYFQRDAHENPVAGPSPPHDMGTMSLHVCVLYFNGFFSINHSSQKIVCAVARASRGVCVGRVEGPPAGRARAANRPCPGQVCWPAVQLGGGGVGLRGEAARRSGAASEVAVWACGVAGGGEGCGNGPRLAPFRLGRARGGGRRLGSPGVRHVVQALLR